MDSELHDLANAYHTENLAAITENRVSTDWLQESVDSWFRNPSSKVKPRITPQCH